MNSVRAAILATLALGGIRALAAEPQLVVQSAHTQKVTAVAVDRQGRWMASGGEDGVIGVWDLRSGYRVRALTGVASAVSGLRFDTHGGGLQLTAIGATSANAVSWDLAQPGLAEPQRRDLGWLRQTSSLDASADGDAPASMAVAGINGFDVWSGAAGSQHWRYRKAGSLFSDIAVSPDGRVVATIAQSGQLTLWRRQRLGGFTARHLGSATDRLRTLFFNRRGQLLVATRGGVAPTRLTLEVWDGLRARQLSSIAVNHRCVLTPLAFSDAGHVAVGTGTLQIFLHGAWISRLDPEPGCETARLGLIAPQQPSRLRMTDIAAAGLTVAAFDEAGGTLGLGYADGTVGTVAVPPGDPASLVLKPLGAGALAPVVGLALFDDGQALAVASGKRLTMWDGATGHPRYSWTADGTIQALAGSAALGRYAVGEARGTVTVKSVALGEPLYRREFGGDDLRLAFSPEGDRLAVGRGSVFFSPGTPRLSLVTFTDPQDPATATVRDLPNIKQDVQALAYSSDGLTLASGHMNLDNDPAPRATLKLLDSRSGAERPSPFAMTRSAVLGLAYASGSPLLAIASAESLLQGGRNFLLWDAGARQMRHTDPDQHFNNNVAVSPNGKLVALGALLSEEQLTLWDSVRGKRLAALPGHSARIAALAFNGDHQLLSGSEDGTVRLWRTPAAPQAVLTPQATLVNFSGNEDWLVGAADGQFDTNNLDRLDALAWIFPDDPLRAFPAEIFTRALYRPGLLGRLLSCAGKIGCDIPAPPARIDALNRVQPEVEVTAVLPGRTADEALVEVRVAGRRDPSQRNGQTQTDAYDLRLFRDGKLVGQWPPPAAASAGDAGLDAWRHASLVPDGIHVFPVRLPRGAPQRSLELTAYAFNRDRVKSTTARWSGTRPVPAGAPAAPKAYVLTVGINAYDDPALTLKFAAKDARDLSAALGRFQGYEVVRLSLLSDHQHGDVASIRQATKANVHDVLTLLAGDDGTARARLQTVPGIDQAALMRFTRATPDDLVIVTFSSHGYADADGQFYLLPSDTGSYGGPAPPDRERLISSIDLSLWLRQVDAGHMALIIDACHAGGFVDIPGFRPGPLGDAGFGQLAYDKGMMILAATQANDVALEVGQLRQGLLTYALVNATLAPDRRTPSRLAADTNGDGLTLREWLNYGVQQVPALYAAIRSRTLALDPVQRNPSVDRAQWLEQLARKGQTPILFDFQKGGDDPLLLPGRP